MRVYENSCVGCPPEMGCLGSACPNMQVARYICDECGDEAPLYDVDGKELCEFCALKTLDKVEESWS